MYFCVSSGKSDEKDNFHPRTLGPFEPGVLGASTSAPPAPAAPVVASPIGMGLPNPEDLLLFLEHEMNNIVDASSHLHLSYINYTDHHLHLSSQSSSFVVIANSKNAACRYYISMPSASQQECATSAGPRQMTPWFSAC